ncbi:hypothetical protein KIN20_008369 [Parelaphostrongylus tenuis]|uniref:Lysosome-associated membrane glycoprotein 2-like transmembrane domain-containing protein n=1 Tax=Parelaphostrongylus tenuis TaxID=148309 RepID=A0AAD5QKL0_PARTN|nr:hypothetical protein KIN20_008369 [Parelaphostrongylus tenuis]
MLRLGVFTVLFTVAYAGLHWNVTNDSTNKTCIVLDADSVMVTVKLTAKNGTVHTYNTAINSTVNVAGNCVATYGNQTAQELEVQFLPAPNETFPLESRPWKLKLIFGSVEKNYAFKLLNYSLHIVNSSIIYDLTKAGPDVDLLAHDNDAFKCSTTKLGLSNDSMIEMKNVRAIAFAQLDKPEFSKQQIYEQCPLDSRTSDIVPIVVGACLAGLVVIVLVAYLIGRARAKRQGYASV